ncbi:MAG: restriction endonuclease [Saprospiraceae bacterium]
MDFNQLDIRGFLIGALPGRFNQLSPSEFESFIEYLFKVDGYEVEPISRKSDLTANLIAKKEDTTLVIRVMRYMPEQILGELEVQQAIAAKDFYETDQSWIITTSGFSKEARVLAENAEIELWDWETLNTALSDLFFEGRNYLEFSDAPIPPSIDTNFEPALTLKTKWEAQEGVEGKWYNLMLTISNPTEENLYIHLDLPVLIDKQKTQISADKWADEEFVAGMIYAGASVRTNALFKTSKVGERPPAGKIVVTCHERVPQRTYHLMAKLKGEACYFVTYCYSRRSQEYELMTRFRDQVLSHSIIGKVSIDIYYLSSPFLVQWASRIKIIDLVLRKLTSLAVAGVTKYYLNKTRF